MDTRIVWTPSEECQTARQQIPEAPRGREDRPRASGLNVLPGQSPGKALRGTHSVASGACGRWRRRQTFRHEPPSVYALSSWQQTSRGSRKASPPDLESMPILSTSAGVGLPTSAQTSIKCYCDPALSLSWASAHLVENSCDVMRGWPSLS